jgi:hypothetical protein
MHIELRHEEPLGQVGERGVPWSHHAICSGLAASPREVNFSVFVMVDLGCT